MFGACCFIADNWCANLLSAHYLWCYLIMACDILDFRGLMLTPTLFCKLSEQDLLIVVASLK